MARIDYYFSLSSPFAYLAGEGLETLAERHRAKINYIPVDLIVVFAGTGGVPVGRRHPARLDYRAQDLLRGARKAGMTFHLQPAFWPVDGTEASAAVIAVAARGGDTGRLVRHLLADCWARERNIADGAVIAEAVATVGLRIEDIAPDLPDAREQFAANTRAAIVAGVFGAPFYIVEGEKFWGRDRLADLDAHLGGLAGER